MKFLSELRRRDVIRMAGMSARLRKAEKHGWLECG
jgi:hypothetical protein